MSDNPFSYIINGVKVYFPIKAYPSQLIFMSSVIKALTNEQNVLLESPTGSGKTLSLLCSTLSWQQGMKDQINRHATTGCKETVNLTTDEVNEKEKSSFAVNKENCYEDHEDDPCCSPSLFQNVSSNILVNEIQTSCSEEVQSRPAGKTESQASSEDIELDGKSKEEMSEIPKIYYCARTHKQINQVVSELKKTPFAKNVKMTILASRTNLCINNKALKSDDVNKSCIDMNSSRTNQKRCPYFRGENRFASYMDSVRNHLKDPNISVWNIEEISEIGKKCNLCPYYFSQDLHDSAEIVFSPYNYLIDPFIRKHLGLNLSNSIVIIDEAHNLEDVIRSSHSLYTNEKLLLDASLHLERLAQLTPCFYDLKIDKISVDAFIQKLQPAYRSLSDFLASFSRFIHFTDHKYDRREFLKSRCVIPGPESIRLFTHLSDINFDKLQNVTKSLNEVAIQEAKRDYPDSNERLTNSVSDDLLRTILMILNHMMNPENQSCAQDYIVQVIENLNSRPSKQLQPPPSYSITSDESMNTDQFEKYEIAFICLNPAIGFCTLSATCRSVILASGTLSPMESYAPELGSSFPICYRANHPMKPNQLLACSLACGPNNRPITFTFKEKEIYEVQEQVLRTLTYICSVVPFGVLAFFPSYSYLEKIVSGWKETEVWSQLKEKKPVYIEERADVASSIEIKLLEYYAEAQSRRGALFLGVFRGRASEGVDFSDNKCRALLTIGIPYPNIRVPEVESKMAFNDRRKKSNGFDATLTGREWYEIQAFRALNQALGRCIRHAEDWGIVIMLDLRLCSPSNMNILQKLPSYITRQLTFHQKFDDFREIIKEFINERMIHIPQEHFSIAESKPRGKVSTYFSEKKEEGNKKLKLEGNKSSSDSGKYLIKQFFTSK